ncbi:efflux RND transporter periplasmic adaptor subunit [Marilutibacter alkalisoli]|uniref:HlyD family efflux transporter periplasmic adaptor subunit n=1 Tax=Marilutibacter alkalisoli TaxID=2591633 RepID=A0A514BNQ7_9GAMM|nr:HlyD family efflux transporter periplasmic adaptor subunit [Lysobacter alkalisoli]QDH69028.1 HlyD family efflux transporter periplasmic adaptor subunit [Lysobacter alkalisoli]
MSIRDTSAQDVHTSPPRSRRLLRRWLLPGVVSALVLIGLAWVVFGWSGAARSVDATRLRIAEVTRGDLVRDISAEGRVIAANSPTLYAVASGTVALKVVAGDVVKQGQILAEIDSPELRSKLAQEESTLASLQAEADRTALDARIARAEARKLVEQAQVERTAAERELQRSQRAYEAGVVAEVDFAKAKDALKKADIGLASTREDANLQGQGANLDARNKQLLAERQHAVVTETRRQVDALSLRSPFNGQVGQIQVAQHSNVVASAPVLSVVDLALFEVEIKVPESFARDLGIGMPAEIRSGTELFPAEVSAVSAEVVNGEVAARLRFSDRQPPGLRQNQRLSARILLDTQRDVLMVERGPFVEQGGGQYAYVIDGNFTVKRPISIGRSSVSAVEIISGLKAGDRVVVFGSEAFQNEPKVRVFGL